VAHACNPSRDQEDHCPKSVRENSSQDPTSKKQNKTKKTSKRVSGVAQGVGPEFKLQYQKKNKEGRKGKKGGRGGRRGKGEKKG
jgi:hypothetical protein